MGLFSKSQPPELPPEPEGGEAIIRKALAVRLRKRENLFSLSRNLEIPNSVLLEVAEGQRNLNEQVSCRSSARLPLRQHELRRGDR